MQPINPYLTNPYMQQSIMPPIVQQPSVQLPVQTGGIRVSGRDEALNRLLMLYPANQLVPGFTSDALFDVDGRHFHALSIESDGSRNLETFAYQLESAPAQTEYVSRAEFQELADRLNQIIGDANGVSKPVQGTAEQSA